MTKIWIVELLLDGGADVNALSYSSETAIHLSGKNGKADIAKLLITRDEIIDKKSNMFSRTPREKALCWGNTELVALLGKAEVAKSVDEKAYREFKQSLLVEQRGINNNSALNPM